MKYFSMLNRWKMSQKSGVWKENGEVRMDVMAGKAQPPAAKPPVIPNLLFGPHPWARRAHIDPPPPPSLFSASFLLR